MVTQTPPQGAPADTNAANGPGAQAGRGGQSSEPSARQVAGRRWRSARGVVAVILAMVVVAVILAALRPSTSPQALDPTSPKQDGSGPSGGDPASERDAGGRGQERRRGREQVRPGDGHGGDPHRAAHR